MTGSVTDIIVNLQEAIDTAKGLGYRNLEIEWGSHADGTRCYDLTAERPETDAELERRMNREAEEEKKERALYEKLKAKFE